MAIKKKYEDTITVGGSADQNLKNAMSSLEAAGFKKVRQEGPLLRVKGDFKPIIGTLYGDITLDFVEAGENTRIDITVIAAVDNAYALMSSPGERLKKKFLDVFNTLSVAPSSGPSTDVTSKLKRLEALRDEGVISDEEYRESRLKIIGEV